MIFFDKFVSNSMAGSGNQLYFSAPEKQIGRCFYKITVGGSFDYSLLFSNIIDSTYSDGSVSHKNLICDSWTIHGARIGRCSGFPSDASVCDIDAADIEVFDFKEITFFSQKEKNVMPGEFFFSDPVSLDFKKNEFLCVEIEFSGDMIPYHEESLLPVYVKENNSWKYSKNMPFAGMIGCDRACKARVGFIGDSITQGIGTTPNRYAHWNALLSDKIGEDYAFWNLGLGYGRANDAASDGAWLYKAKQNDIIFVCYGVNDIQRGQTEEQIKKDLTYIVDTLKKLGKTVVLQTVPPFNYVNERIEKWHNVNEYIKNELSERADLVFDCVPTLGKSEEEPHMSKYGGHPDEEGCAAWADALFEAVKKFFP